MAGREVGGLGKDCVEDLKVWVCVALGGCGQVTGGGLWVNGGAFAGGKVR